MPRVWLLSWLLQIGMSLPAAVLAQERPGGSLSVDVTLGAGALAGGDFLHRTAMAGDGTLALRLRGEVPGGALLALSGGLQAPLGNAVACPSGGECTGEHPIFYSVGALLGWERSTPTMSTRVLGGPAVYHATADGYGRDGSATVFGMQLRGDLSLRWTTRTAIVFSARSALLPDLAGHAIGLGAIGMGIRFR